MDIKSVLSSMQDFSYREKEIIKYKNMYFSEDERTKCLKIKEHLKQELTSNFKIMIQDDILNWENPKSRSWLAKTQKIIYV